MTDRQSLAPLPALRDAVRLNLRPVRRLRPPVQRALALAPLAIGTLACAVLVFSLRQDSSTLGWPLTWGASVLQVLLGVWLIALALQDAVPGRQVTGRTLATAVGVLVGFSIGLTLVTWRVSPIGIRRAWALITTECFVGTWVTALPLLLGAVLLASRAFPTRPWSTGVLGGLGAGAAADAGWRLFCHFTEPAHVMLSHTAGMLAAGLAGVLLAGLCQQKTTTPERRT